MANPNGKLTGKASFFILAGDRVYLTKYSPSVDKTLADTTDGADYDPASRLIHATQQAVKVAQTLDVEGVFDVNRVPQKVIALLYSNVDAVPVQLGLDAGILFGSGLFDIENFSCDVPIDDKVTWKASFKSNGIFTPGGTL
ncbi:hypothetical protein [Singulisphaera sp. PoT]|uniref:hypothetical protein n=1 Tax=Singulisphaera sp. PoT TaxID=3411797 RepID=UPI003BF4B663